MITIAARTLPTTLLLGLLAAGCGGPAEADGEAEEAPPVATVPACHDRGAAVLQGSLLWLRPDGTVRLRTDTPWRELPAARPVEDGVSVWAATGSRVRRFDAATGTERWAVPVAGTARTLALEDGVLVLAVDDGTLLGLSADSGAERWRRTTTDVPVPTGDGGVALSSTGELRVVDAATGRDRWLAQAPGRAEVRLVPGLLVRRVGGGFRAFDLATGAVRWSSPPVPDAARVETVTGQLALVTDRAVRALSLETGEPVWDHVIAAGQEVAVGPAGVVLRGPTHLTLIGRTGTPDFDVAVAVVPGSDAQVLRDLVVGVERGPTDERVLVARSTAGEVLWQVPRSGDVAAVVAPDERTLLVVGRRDVTGLDRRTGEERWSTTVGGSAARSTSSSRGLLLQVGILSAGCPG